MTKRARSLCGCTFRLGVPRAALPVVCVAVLAVLLGTNTTEAGPYDDIGLTSLQQRLGSNMPTGAGVTAMQVEAPDNFNNYVADQLDAQLDSTTITDIFDLDGDPSGVSDHATNVAKNFFGTQGVSPGVAEVDAYDANYWINSGFLNTSTSSEPLNDPDRRRDIQNHSWIGNFYDEKIEPVTPESIVSATNLSRRMDLVIVRDNVVSVAGLHNGMQTTFPQILGNTYNTIAVGRTDGNHSRGPTLIDTAGRVKPDIVAPSGFTSFATPWVSGAAALLLETADDLEIAGDVDDARSSETIKALLMAGATKDEDEFDSWSRTEMRPLDAIYGAGELNIDNSHRILTAGQFDAAIDAVLGSTGWDFGQITSNTDPSYFFEIPTGHVADVSILATWHRQVVQNGSQLTVSLANLDLEFSSADGFVATTPLDQSRSTVDNVEHVYQQDLGVGRYLFSLNSDSSVDYAVAWQSTLRALVPGDANADFVVNENDLAILLQSWEGDALFEHGDFDFNGLVDAADLALLLANWGRTGTLAVSPPPAGDPAVGVQLNVWSVPEPTTATLIAILGLLFPSLIARRGRRR